MLWDVTNDDGSLLDTVYYRFYAALQMGATVTACAWSFSAIRLYTDRDLLAACQPPDRSRRPTAPLPTKVAATATPAACLASSSTTSRTPIDRT